MTLIAVGDRADRIVSWSSFATTTDGRLWSQTVTPFTNRCKAVGVAYGLNRYVVISDAGYVSNSQDGVVWQDYQIEQGTLAPLSIEFANNIFVIAGQQKFLTQEGPYDEFDEAAQLLVNTTGDNWNWRLIYSQDGKNSRFYNVKYISDAPTPLWIALGSADSKPFAIYSTDDGVTFNEVEFPQLEGVFAAYDAVWNIDKFYITLNGIILNTDDLVSPTWGASQPLAVPYGSTDLVKIEKNPFGHMVVVCSGGIFYSLDQVGWTLFSPVGYRFKSISWYNDLWFVGADSTLTTYTYWTSSDTVSWTAEFQPFQAYDFTQI